MFEEKIIEVITNVIYEFFQIKELDYDEIINYWGGETPQEYIFKGEDEEWN